MVSENLNGSIGLPIVSMGAFLVSNIDEVRFYDILTYNEVEASRIQIPLLKSETRERNEVISMQKSSDDETLAVITGKNLCMNMQMPNQLFIFKRVKNLNTG